MALFQGLCRFCGGATTQFQDYLEPEWNEDGSVAGSFTIRAYEHSKCVAKDLREQDRAAFRDLCRDNLKEVL